MERTKADEPPPTSNNAGREGFLEGFEGETGILLREEEESGFKKFDRSCFRGASIDYSSSYFPRVGWPLSNMDGLSGSHTNACAAIRIVIGFLFHRITEQKIISKSFTISKISNQSHPDTLGYK